MKISKAMWFTIFLLTFAIVEFFIILYDITHPFHNDFSLANYSSIVSQREVNASPFAFETSFMDFVNHETNIMSKSVMFGVVPTVYKENRKSMLANDDLAEQIKAIEQDNSVTSIETADAKIAIVIDDMGISPKHTKEILSLNLPITLAFLPYGNSNKEIVEEAIKQGYQAMVHVPMMPHNPKNLAPVTLSSDMSEEEITANLTAMLNRFKGLDIKGINNHMGSLFTEDEEAMTIVMETLKKRNLFFLDSKTSKDSIGKWTAEDNGVKTIARDIFLDNEDDYDYIINQLRETEKLAVKKGYAVAIGHPRTHTYEAIRDWASTLDKGHSQLVFVSELVK